MLLKNKDILEGNSSLKNRETARNTKIISEKNEKKSVSETEVEIKKYLSERWKTNRFWLIRGSYYLMNAIWMIVMVVGGFIAWLISLLFI